MSPPPTWPCSGLTAVALAALPLTRRPVDVEEDAPGEQPRQREDDEHGAERHGEGLAVGGGGEGGAEPAEEDGAGEGDAERGAELLGGRQEGRRRSRRGAGPSRRGRCR